MKTITIRELHARTGRWVRQARRHGHIVITDNGRAVARLVPDAGSVAAPYFSRRNFISRRLKERIETGQLGRTGTDSTIGISEDRENRNS